MFDFFPSYFFVSFISKKTCLPIFAYFYKCVLFFALVIWFLSGCLCFLGFLGASFPRKEKNEGHTGPVHDNYLHLCKFPPEKREQEPTSETPKKDVNNVKAQPEEAITNVMDAENTIKLKPKLKRKCNYSHVNVSKMWCYNEMYTQEEFKCWCDTNCPKPCILQENKK